MMVLRLPILAGLVCLAIAGPVTWDDSKCSTKCRGGTKFQYQHSPPTKYIYSYESTNSLTADGASDLSMGLKAKLEITALSQCEMVLQVQDVSLQHGTIEVRSSAFIDELKRNPLPFSWDDGKIENVCPTSEDSNEVNNIKKAMLSAFQSTARSFEFKNSFEREVDIFGSCDTEYHAKSEKNVVNVKKEKKIHTCTDHLRFQSLLVASFYESTSPAHLPFLTQNDLTCNTKIKEGIIEEVTCEEAPALKPLADLGYTVDAKGKVVIKKLQSQPGSPLRYRVSERDSLKFHFSPIAQKSSEADLQNEIRHICENSRELLTKDLASSIHRLVYLIRGLDEQTLEKTYQSLKSKQLCPSHKALTIFVDALRSASNGGAIGLLTKLVEAGDISELDATIWMTLMPFTPYLEEKSISAAVPLLKKDSAKKQALLGVSSMTYKYCKTHEDCKNSAAVKEVSSSLKQFLGNKCETSNNDEEDKIITALKAFGNLGYIGESADGILDCAGLRSNKLTIRLSAIEAFRRTPCEENILSKLFDLYKSKQEEDEIRIAALNTLSKCVHKDLFNSVAEVYKTETSKQVQVFTWSFLDNLLHTSDPTKARIAKYISALDIHPPPSTDITKFSRHFEKTIFSEFLNMGPGIEGNVIYSKASFLPRSANIGLKANVYGNQLNLIEVGGRVEDLEHVLEKVFGPRGLLPNLELDDLLAMVPLNQGNRKKRSADSYKSKIEALSDRFGYNRGKDPHGTSYIRVLGHEIAWIHYNKNMFDKYAEFDLEAFFRNLASSNLVDKTRSLLFLDTAILSPSVTGRAYKLSSNVSLTLGYKREGKMDLQQQNVDIDGRIRPSILSATSGSFTIHSESFEPGVRVETVFNAGIDLNTKLEIKNGRLLHIKVKKEQDRQEIISLKRTIYSMNERGVVEHAKPPSYNLNYCTTYLQHFVGVKYCASGSIPHVYNQAGKPKIPLVRALEASIVAEKTDKDMEGYELLLELPDLKAKEKKFRFLLDTPKSSIDRKISLEFSVKKPSADSCLSSLKIYNPLYSLDVTADITNREENFRMKVDGLADKKRRYTLLLDVGKDVKGARLVEYSPKLSLLLPNVRPIELTGTVVFARGRKEQITVNLQSGSFDSPFLIKGHTIKEGGTVDLDSDWKLHSELNITAFSQIHRLHSSLGNEVDSGVFLSAGHHYEPDGKSYESVSVSAKLENLDLRDRLQFSLETEVLLAEHQDLNSRLRWDFSFKPFAHWRDELDFRYGPDFNDDQHVVHFVHITAFNGDFDTFQRLDIENKLGLTISCFNIDASGALSVGWDFVDKSTFFIEVGGKSKKDREISVKYNYKHVKVNPLHMKSNFKLVFYDYTLLYENDLVEETPQNYKGKAVLVPKAGKQVHIDYTYKIRDEGKHQHNFDGQIRFPEKPDPVEVKTVMIYDDDSFKFNGLADAGDTNKFSLDMNLVKDGESSVELATPFIEGKAAVQSKDSDHTVKVEFKEKSGKYDGKVEISGTVSLQELVSTLDLNVLWDAEKDSEKKVSIKASSNKATEDGLEKRVISATIKYAGAIDVVASGKISSSDILRGPHELRAVFTGNMEPMALELSHEIKNGELNSVAKYLRSDAEKLRLDIKGKTAFTRSKFEIESGMFMSSPYKAFDGKELFFRILAESTDATQFFVSEYRIKPAQVIGYVGKIDYERKRGFPGEIKSNLLVTVHQRPVYQGNTHIEYTYGKYSWKTSFTPVSKKKINLVTSLEHSARFAAFHHSASAALKYIQKVELNAVADLRSTEDAKVQTNLDINQQRLYDVNATLKMRSLIDFESELFAFSKISPAVKLFSKAQPSGQIVKYDMNLNVDNVDLMQGSGELKKRKKGFNGDVSFKYRGKEILLLSLNHEAKSQRERSYLIKSKSSALGQHSASIKIIKEKKAGTKYETIFCKNEDNCINLDVHYKEPGDVQETVISYKRGNIDFSIERIRANTKDSARYHTVIFNGDKRYGYDVRLAKEGNGQSISLGIILPSREVYSKTYVEFSLEKPRLKFEFTTNHRKSPPQMLVADLKFDNHLYDSRPSKLDLTITHPMFEKPIEIQLIGDYKGDSDSRSNKLLTAQLSLDYADPEDKLITKFSLEKSGTSGYIAISEYYYQDTQHLFSKLTWTATRSLEEIYYASEWMWYDDANEVRNAHAKFHYIKAERKFVIDVDRPNLNVKIEGTIVSPHTLLADPDEVQLTYNINGEITKAKIVADYDRDCYNYYRFNDQGEVRRTIELCTSDTTNQLLSLTMDDYNEEDEQMEFAFSLKLIKWYGLRNLRGYLTMRFHIDPQFLGSILFKTTHFMGDLQAKGILGLPFANTARFSKIKSSISDKLVKPMIRFVVPEATKFLADLLRDVTFMIAKLKQYYRSLPLLPDVLAKLQEYRLHVRAILREVWHSVESYYRENFKAFVTFVEKVTQILKGLCDGNEDCSAFVKAYNEKGLSGLCDQIRNFILSLPGKIQTILSKGSGINVRQLYDQVIALAKIVLQPLTKYKCGEIVVKSVQLIHNKVEPHIQKFLDNFPIYVKEIRETIESNKFYIMSKEFVRNAYSVLKEELMKIDIGQWITSRLPLVDLIAEYSPGYDSCILSFKKTNPETGEFETCIPYYPKPLIADLDAPAYKAVAYTAAEYDNFGWENLLVKFKRGADLNFFPPYEAQAMIVGNSNFITFDKAFYDFEGECSYLLSRDFEDGNFTFALKPKEADKGPAIIAIINDVTVELNSGDRSVIVNDQPVELPYLSPELKISLSGSTFHLCDRHGVSVDCSTVHELCAFSLSGWYFGKTGGLLGTYNYESYDEFKRPKGQIANSGTTLAKSWELKKGCKSNNLLPDTQTNNPSVVAQCKAQFKDRSSKLSACFREVDPEEYFQLCLRYLSRDPKDASKRICNVAAAYVTECERNYIELNLPVSCLSCEAPDGSKLEQGDRKKFNNLSKKSADVIFIVEDHECNKGVLDDLSNLARSIDRELQNEGYKDSQFGLVGYGGDIGEPEIFTVKGKSFFSSRDVASIRERIKLENQKTESSRAFEAMQLAVSYLFRSDSAKSFVLFSCSACKYDYTSLMYPVVQQILLERGITLHVVNSADITIRKSSIKEKDIIGADADTVYHSKDMVQKDLVGDPSLRSQITLPKDLCVALSQDVSGSFFSTSRLKTELKNWRGVFSRKFVKSVQSFPCQWCDCTSTRDHVPNTVCQPCEAKRPRLPFSVCKSCHLPRTLESFFAYLRNIAE